MGRYDVDDEDEGVDREAPDEAEWDPDGGEGVGTEDCPYCGEEIYEGAVKCPGCGKYLSEEDAPRKRKPWWILLAVALAMAAVLTWIL